MKSDTTSDGILAQYRPIRAGIQHVVRLAVGACGKPDWTRAIKQVAPWADTEELEQSPALEMISDIALFEPNQRGRRVFNTFLSTRANRLEPADRALAQRMASAWFSIFRVAETHEAAGLWLEDLLNGNKRLWLVDEGLRASASKDMVFGLRLFDAGPFHAAFGIAVQPDDETLDLCLAAVERGNRLPFRQSLAATLYGDFLRDHAPLEKVNPMLMGFLSKMLDPETGGIAAPPERTPPARKPRRRRKTDEG